SNLRMYFACFVVLLGAFSVGTMIGMTSSMIPGIQNNTSPPQIQINSQQASWLAAVLTLSGMIGGVLAGKVTEYIGRKYSSIISGLPFIAGLLLISFAREIWMLFVGRILTGIGLGLISFVVPIYIGEVATSETRGMLGSGNQLCIVSGILYMYGMGSILPWRSLALSALPAPSLLFLLSFLIPETPQFLLMKNKRSEAKFALQWLRGFGTDVDDEYHELEQSITSDVKFASWCDIIRDSSLRTPMLLSLVAMYFQQMSGINCVMFYAKSIFQNAGFVTSSQLTMALLLVASVQVVFTVISCLTVDRIGRRISIVVGAILMSISLAAFGLYFQLTATNRLSPVHSNVTTVSHITQHPHNNLTWLPLTSMAVFIAAYSVGIGPIAWLLVGEIIPIRARERAAALSTGFNFFMVFILTLVFSDMLVIMTSQGTFWFFAANCLLSIVFVGTCLPETKGRSLEEIEQSFRRK
uniref:Solute carrier family 2, facilitated glucose transporter member 8 n=1 Tax=Ciona savignyi TaxID=51511 RepID=H2ZKH7_CIOSA